MCMHVVLRMLWYVILFNWGTFIPKITVKAPGSLGVEPVCMWRLCIR